MRPRALIAIFALYAMNLAQPVSAQEIVGEGNEPGTKVIVRDLKRDDGGTVTLRFQVMNEQDKSLKTYGLLGQQFGMDYVHLIDAANKKKYLVVTDSAKKCVCSELTGGQVKKGERFNMWVKFPAPPQAVQKITVVIPGFEPIESVPITSR